VSIFDPPEQRPIWREIAIPVLVALLGAVIFALAARRPAPSGPTPAPTPAPTAAPAFDLAWKQSAEVHRRAAQLDGEERAEAEAEIARVEAIEDEDERLDELVRLLKGGILKSTQPFPAPASRRD